MNPTLRPQNQYIDVRNVHPPVAQAPQVYYQPQAVYQPPVQQQPVLDGRLNSTLERATYQMEINRNRLENSVPTGLASKCISIRATLAERLNVLTEKKFIQKKKLPPFFNFTNFF